MRFLRVLFPLAVLLVFGAAEVAAVALSVGDAVVITDDDSVWHVATDGTRTLITDGSTIGMGPPLIGLGHLVVDAANRIYVATEDNLTPGSIWEVDAGTGDRRLVAGVGTGVGEDMLTVRDIALFANRDLAAIGARTLSPARNAIWRIDPATGDRDIISAAGGSLPEIGGGDFGLFAADMDISSDDLILVPNVSGHVMQIALDGFRTRFEHFPSLGFVLGITFESPLTAVQVDTASGDLVRIPPDNATHTVVSGNGIGSGPFWGTDLTGGVDVALGSIYLTVEGANPGVYLADTVTGDRTYLSAFPFGDPAPLDVAAVEPATCSEDLVLALDEIAELQDELAATQAELDICNAATPDTDGDGVHDANDTCPATPGGSVVDASGCSKPQFCSAIQVNDLAGIIECFGADFLNDTPHPYPFDCTVQGPWGSLTCIPL